jgi:hypothetical protein
MRYMIGNPQFKQQQRYVQHFFFFLYKNMEEKKKRLFGPQYQYEV